jgi:hypothetical protein
MAIYPQNLTWEIPEKVRATAKVDHKRATVQPAPQPLSDKLLGQRCRAGRIVVAQERDARVWISEDVSGMLAWKPPVAA